MAAVINLLGPVSFGQSVNQVAVPAGSALFSAYRVNTVQRIGYVRFEIANIGANNITAFQLNTATAPSGHTIQTLTQASFGTSTRLLPYDLNTSGFTGAGIPPGESFAFLLLAAGIGQAEILLASTSGTTTDISVNFEPYSAR